jgi:hypothetical protein
MEEFCCVRGILCIMVGTFMLYGKACCGVLWVDQFVCCVDNQAVCYGWKILITGEAHCVLWMLHFRLIGKHTVVCCGWTSLPTVWIHVQYVLDKTVMLCGQAHDVFWKRSLWRIALFQGMKFCRQGKEKIVCYGIILLSRQNVERAVTLSLFDIPQENYGNISLGKKLNLRGRTRTWK